MAGSNASPYVFASGPEHPDTLVTAHLYAFGCLWEGWHGGEELALEVHAVTGEKLGLDHPFAIAARAQLAWWNLEAARPQEALELFEATIEPCERVLGADHWVTGMTMVGLATAMRGKTGERERRAALLDGACASRVGSSYKELARRVHAEMTFASGQRDAAIEQLRDLVHTLERAHGERSTAALLARYRLACAIWLDGDVTPGRRAEADAVFEQVATILAEQGAPLAPELEPCARAVLASATNDAAREQALAWARSACQAPATAAGCATTLGMALLHAAQLEPARETLERALAADGRDPATWATLARVQRALGQPDTARASLARATASLAQVAFVEDLERCMLVERARLEIE